MIRGIWTAQTVAWVMAAALVPVLAVVIAETGWAGGWRIAISLITVVVWQTLFAVVRGQPMLPIGAVAAVAVGVLAPGDLAWWQLVAGLTFGTVIAEAIFGGWGRNVVNGAVATLAFLFFSFPEVRHDPASSWIALACIPAGLLLLITGILSWRVLAGAVAGLLATTLVFGADGWILPAQGGLAFGFVFLIGDPVSSAATNPGRWIYGVLAGALAGLFGWGADGIGAPQAIVFAALLASIFAPLIDYLVVAWLSAQARRQHG